MKHLRRRIAVIAIAAAVASASNFTASADDGLAYGAATVSATQLNVRTAPNTSSSVVMQVVDSDIVVILEKTNNEWFKVNFNGVVGYTKSEYYRDVLRAENFNATGKLVGDGVFVREGPSTEHDALAAYDSGTLMSVIGINNGWYKVRHEGWTGYVRSDYMTVVSQYKPDSTTLRTAARAASSPAPAHSKTGNELVDFALGFLGSRYVYGGASPSGFDCSGFTTYVYKNFGISLTRNASGQYRDNGVHIDKSELGAGDLVFFSSNGRSVTHVGLYIGDEEFIHASTSSTGVIISRLDSAYYTRVWFGAKRVV
ncbi:MAG: C40 family peptidase [Oscillospiraceae bacterium]|jgi:cell wall-associated NlpC family hydrolase|nr:C40 family peptidase [Oscillospiraceae bacterium]